MTKRMRTTSARKAGFSKKHLRTRKDSPKQAIQYLKQKSSFFVAAFSLAAFISGNMLGQHGWYAFWKAALGQYDDSLITYTGTVPPVALVPDYERWSQYGGNGEVNTYRQVPKDLLVPLPPYNQKEERHGYEGAHGGDIYSVGHMGSYETGGEGDGSHVGVDIRVPEGTPVRSIANGIVTRVADDPGGFGKLIVIRHPHMPDPDNPDYETVLYSNYAHLSAQFVEEGQTVSKGDNIGLSGQTGFATGPHLHFQIDRDTAPWHPYWAFSYTEARAAGYNTVQAINAAFMQQRGYENTVHPMLLVQANYPPAKYKQDSGAAIVRRATTVTQRTSTRTTVTAKTLLSAAEQRKQERLAARGKTTTVVVQKPASSSSRAAVVTKSDSIVVRTETVAADAVPAHEAAPVIVSGPKGDVASVDIQHDRQFRGREWEKVRLTLLDKNGNALSGDSLKGTLYMRTAYGSAEFKPATLTASDFVNGTAVVEMLPRGDRTVVITVEPLKSMSKPMEYVGN